MSNNTELSPATRTGVAMNMLAVVTKYIFSTGLDVIRMKVSLML